MKIKEDDDAIEIINFTKIETSKKPLI